LEDKPAHPDAEGEPGDQIDDQEWCPLATRDLVFQWQERTMNFEITAGLPHWDSRAGIYARSANASLAPDRQVRSLASTLEPIQVAALAISNDQIAQFNQSRAGTAPE
jgi:hypothetical protein